MTHSTIILILFDSESLSISPERSTGSGTPIRLQIMTIHKCSLPTLLLAVLMVAGSTVRLPNVAAFVGPSRVRSTRQSRFPVAIGATVVDGVTKNEQREKEKNNLLQLLRVRAVSEPPYDSTAVIDPVLADPITKEPVVVMVRSSSARSASAPTVLLGGASDSSPSTTRYEIVPATSARSKTTASTSAVKYAGSSDTYLNLLEPVVVGDTEQTETDSSGKSSQQQSSSSPSVLLFRNLVPFIPPPLRPVLARAGLFPTDKEYIPMRDLFTSPTVSYAYERGWRQSFQQAGFPGPDREAELAMEYFEPAMARSGATRVLVDMSCATGLFTRRFAASQRYRRVLGCDYSDSMLLEARRRIRSDRQLQQQQRQTTATQLDLVRLDVGQIPMRDGSVDALHAGAAMHCWPDLPAAASEIYRVLKPGGRYFATTFMSSYFGRLQGAEGGASGPSQQAFQYFESVQQLRKLMEEAGFDHDKVLIEVLGRACVVIRCEK
jgi:ubiquinone/menaquinone biosynthesis C-methylase UbiE